MTALIPLGWLRLQLRLFLGLLPIVEDFDDPVCQQMYDQVDQVGRRIGFQTLQVVEAFRGQPPDAFRKASDPWDVTHPNAAGHLRIAAALADRIQPLLVANPAAPPPLEFNAPAP